MSTATMTREKSNQKKMTIAHSNGKKFVLKDWQRNLLIQIGTSVFTVTLVVVAFYFNTKSTLADHTEKINTLQTDVAVTKKDVNDIKTDVAVLKTDVGSLKQDVRDMKSDVKEVREDVKKIYEILLTKQK